MKLIGFPPSPNTWKVRADAAHLGIPTELDLVDLTKGQSHAPEYLSFNPTGRTPTLIDGDFKLWETGAILQYIASQKPNSLWPDDVRVRADIMRWQSWAIAHWDKEGCVPLLAERLIKQILNLGPPDEAVVATALEQFRKNAHVLADHLGRQRWLVGDDITLARIRQFPRRAEFGLVLDLGHADTGTFQRRLDDHRQTQFVQCPRAILF